MQDELIFQSIEETGRRLDLDDSVIEKDYYVTQVIKALSTMDWPKRSMTEKILEQPSAFIPIMQVM